MGDGARQVSDSVLRTGAVTAVWVSQGPVDADHAAAQLAIADFDAVSANGAQITASGSGLNYDPSSLSTAAREALLADGIFVDSFTYLVADPTGATGPERTTVRVTVSTATPTSPNNPPIGNPDAASTDEDTPATILVLANDTDGETPTGQLQNVSLQNLAGISQLGAVVASACHTATGERACRPTMRLTSTDPATARRRATKTRRHLPREMSMVR